MGKLNKHGGIAFGAGVVGVLSGMAVGQALPNAPYKAFGGFEGNARLGTAVLAAGDMNGDGIADYFVGSPGSSVSESGAGAVFLRSGANGSVIQTYSDIGSDSFGWSIIRAGDFDNDGVEDIIIGDPDRFVGCMKRGAFHLFSGAEGFQFMALVGETLDERFASALANAGDVNGDGVSDFIVGAPQFGNDHNGRVIVYSGTDLNVLFTSTGPPGGKLGFSVAGLGDVNGDGHSDIAVGAPGVGKVMVFDAHNQQLIRTLNGSTMSQFGRSLTAVDDLTGDGVNELFVGLPYQGVSIQGRVVAYNPVTGQIVRTILGASGGDGFGFTVACAGDVNGDGYNDVLVSAPWEISHQGYVGAIKAVDPLTGHVIRQFSGGASFSAFGSALCAAGDVNGDGYGDLLVGAAEAGVAKSGAAYVFLGGDNELGLGAAVHSGTSVDKPTAIAVADLNGDGREDVASVSTATNRVDVMFSNANGTLSAPVRYVVNGQPTAIAAADLDGDGRMDLAVTLANKNQLLLMRQGSNGKFTAVGTRKVGKQPSAVVAADLNNDGMPDLVVANRASNTVTVFSNSSTPGVFLGSRLKVSKTYAVKKAPTQIAVGDVNGDTKMDLIVVNSGSGNISTLLGGAYGFSSQKVTAVGSQPCGVAVADFNGDWFDDVAVINKASNAVTIRLGSYTGTFVQPQTYALPANPVAIAALDADYDGWPDIATVNADGTASLLISDDSTGFEPPMSWPAGSGPAAMVVGDIDGDADLDVIIARPNARKISVMFNQWF